MSLDEYMGQNKDPFENVGFIDVRRKKRINIKIIDTDGDEVDLKEMIDNLNRYITDNMEREDANTLKDETSPLIMNLFMGALTYATGHPTTAAFIASQDSMRYSITHLMLLSFYFIKFIQKNDLKVVTEEKDIDDEELDRIRRVNQANSVATMGAMMGIEPKEIIREMIKSGQLNKDDLSSAMQEHIDDVSDKEEVSDSVSSEATNKKPGSNSN